MNIITFYTKAQGSSHAASGKPCQDNGGCFSKDGLHIAVVCDRHGSDSYVRSQDGSRLAAQITIDEVKKFVQDTPATLFLGKKGAVTSIPTQDPLIDKNGNKRLRSELTESEEALLTQNLQYEKDSSENPDVETQLRQLFSSIHSKWKEAITKRLPQPPLYPSRAN